jgi:predicted small lipoprotein YifL
MKRKTLKWAAVVLLVVGSVAACGEKEKNSEQPLKNTKWKLEGIVDLQTSNMKTLEPASCEECYTLTFDTNYSATVHSIRMELKLDLLKLSDSVNLEGMLWCERYDKDGQDYCDSDDFRRAILTTETHSATKEELKLFYDGKSKYLLFKPLNL